MIIRYKSFLIEISVNPMDEEIIDLAIDGEPLIEVFYSKYEAAMFAKEFCDAQILQLKDVLASMRVQEQA